MSERPHDEPEGGRALSGDPLRRVWQLRTMMLHLGLLTPNPTSHVRKVVGCRPPSQRLLPERAGR